MHMRLLDVAVSLAALAHLSQADVIYRSWDTTGLELWSGNNSQKTNTVKIQPPIEKGKCYRLADFGVPALDSFTKPTSKLSANNAYFDLFSSTNVIDTQNFWQPYCWVYENDQCDANVGKNFLIKPWLKYYWDRNFDYKSWDCNERLEMNW